MTRCWEEEEGKLVGRGKEVRIETFKEVGKY